MKTSLLASTLVCLASVAHAQIPNSSFEDWSSFGGYDDPDGWVSFNGLSAPYGVLVCTMGTPGHTGASFMELTTHNVPGFTIIPGVATTADPASGIDGFPCSERPEALTGYWKYQSQPSDMGLVTITLTKWNDVIQQRDAIGGGYLNTTGNIADWTAFSVPITYISPEDPDTASISFTSSGGLMQEGSTLSVDDLGFDAATAVTDGAFSFPFRAYPSPATDVLTIDHGGMLKELHLTSADGRIVGPISWLSRERIDVSGLSPGAYIVHAELASGTQRAVRFVKR
jgi:hypothetical protein